MMNFKYPSVTSGRAACVYGRLRQANCKACPVTSRQNAVLVEARASKHRRSGNNRHFGKSNKSRPKGLPPASPNSSKDAFTGDHRRNTTAAAAAPSSIAADPAPAAAAASPAAPGTYLVNLLQTHPVANIRLVPRLTFGMTDDYECTTVQHFGDTKELKVDFNARTAFHDYASKLSSAAKATAPQAAAQLVSSHETPVPQQEAPKPVPAQPAGTPTSTRVFIRRPAGSRFDGRRQPQQAQQTGGVPVPHSSSNTGSDSSSGDSVPNNSRGSAPLQRPVAVVAAGGNVSALDTISNASSSGGDGPVWIAAAGPALNTSAAAAAAGQATSKDSADSTCSTNEGINTGMPASGLLFMSELAAKQSRTAAAAATASAGMSAAMSATPAAPAPTAAQQQLAMTPAGPAMLSDDGLVRTASASAFVAATASSGPALLAADGTALTAGAMAFMSKAKSTGSSSGVSKASTAAGAAAGTTGPALVGAGGFAATAGAAAFLAALVHSAHRQSARVLA